MIKFDLVSLDDVFFDVMDHIEANKVTMSKSAGVKELDVDYWSYQEAAKNGQLMVLTLRHDERLVGFSVFLLCPNLRVKTEIEATNHGLWVDAEYRKKYGMRMIFEGPKFLERIGVKRTKFINDSAAFARVMKKFGYEATQQVWSLENGK